ncbi:hypothetical protein [Hahella sp. HN01]|uniref:hypothetical protein n=1 Tax=Hahella sp. HN01 TaxID=2847262 RepID=UPI001C1ED1AB|nr:hypothetical protein [Hahella sp. HN01]MBU6950123.1 hypothetical protein [Hahella sp. HN01]
MSRSKPSLAKSIHPSWFNALSRRVRFCNKVKAAAACLWFAAALSAYGGSYEAMDQSPSLWPVGLFGAALLLQIVGLFFFNAKHSVSE